jgi:long-chain acyl-CoA synthetase
MNVSKSPAFAWLNPYSHPCEWDQHFAPLSLPDLFTQAVRSHPDRVLIDFYGRTFSYARMLTEAQAFASGLMDIGIGKGDRVGLYLPNVPAYVPAYYGAMMAGATVVNFSPLYTAEELEAQVADSGTRLLVTVDAAALLPTAIKVLRGSALETLVVSRLGEQLPGIKGLLVCLFGMGQTAPVPKEPSVVHWRDLLWAGEPNVFPTLDPERDLALLQYTGGTTGTPKGAMLTHQNLSSNARQLWQVDPHRGERDVTLGVLPLFHVFANTCILNRTVLNGGTIVMLPRFDAGQVFDAIARTRPTSTFAVPTMLQALIDQPRAEGLDWSSLRGVISGGAPLGDPLKERFEGLTGVPVMEGYGLTESSGVVTSNPLARDAQRAGIGQPVPGTRVRLLDKDDASADAAPGQPGEIAVQGPQIMQGYWQRPEAAAAAFAEREDGKWLRTGDVGQFDEAGFLHVVDRLKDMIAVGGFKVFPSQVEDVLLQHPAVKEALVIGAPDAYKGEVPRAFVTLREPADAAELRDWLNHRVGKHERVDAVVLREALPKTAIGKLDRKALRAELAGG